MKKGAENSPETSETFITSQRRLRLT